MPEKVYNYMEFNELNAPGENICLTFADENAAKNYLRERVEEYFECEWDEIEEEYIHSGDLFSDKEVHYLNEYDEALYCWEIREQNII